MSSILVGASSVAQLDENLKATEVKLDADDLTALDEPQSSVQRSRPGTVDRRPWTVDHSVRNATSGSIRVARQAGAAHAAIDTTISASGTTMKLSASRVETP